MELNFEIYDMPTILNGIEKILELYFRVEHIGKTSGQQLAEGQSRTKQF